MNKTQESNFSDETYTSKSTIDSPPVEEKESEEVKQTEMFDKKVHDEEGVQRELDGNPDFLRFGVELILKLKRQRVYTIPLLVGEFTNSDVPNLLELALRGRRNKAVIQSILDIPQKDDSAEVLTDGKFLGHPEAEQAEHADAERSAKDQAEAIEAESEASQFDEQFDEQAEAKF